MPPERWPAVATARLPPAAPGASGKTGSGYKVGVLQLVEHGALDQTNKGFVAALDESGIAYTIDQQNAQNDQSACQTIAEQARERR